MRAAAISVLAWLGLASASFGQCAVPSYNEFFGVPKGYVDSQAFVGKFDYAPQTAESPPPFLSIDFTTDWQAYIWSVLDYAYEGNMTGAGTVEADSSHAYRYIPRPGEGETIEVHSAHPAVAFASIQRLLDHCSTNTADLRAASKFPEDWPPASEPVHPVTVREIEERIGEKKSLRTFFEERRPQRPSNE